MKRTGSAVWSGGIKDGKGTLTTESETLSKTPYSFSARFKNAAGTNPEELIAAAHARIPGGDADIFRTEAFHAKENCPVSRVLNTDISVVTTLDMI